MSQHWSTHPHPHGSATVGHAVHLLGRVGGLHGAAGRSSLGLELLHPDAGLVEAEQVANELAEVDAPVVGEAVRRQARSSVVRKGK